jgi:hypothetical protein
VGEFWRILANCGNVTIRHAGNGEITHKKLRPANLISNFRILISVFLSAGLANFSVKFSCVGASSPALRPVERNHSMKNHLLNFGEEPGSTKFPAVVQSTVITEPHF